MHAAETCSSIHLVPIDRGVAEQIKATRHNQHVRWIEHDSLDALDAALEHQEAAFARALVTIARGSELGERWAGRLHRDERRLRLLVAAAELSSADVERIVLGGACAAFGPPWPDRDLEGLFHDRGYLAYLFPELLRAERRETHRLEVPTQRDAVLGVARFIAERCDAMGYPSELVRSILPLVLDEALCNAMDHGNEWDASRRVFVHFDLGAEDFELRITDQGRGFERGEVVSPIEGEALLRHGGRGLYLMESLLDEVRYEDGGRTVVLNKRIGAGSPVPAP